jgi:hypothetical protein
MRLLFLIVFFIPAVLTAYEKPTLQFSGQATAWQAVQFADPSLWMSGGRFVPELKGKVSFDNGASVDMEASLNINGSVDWKSITDPDAMGQVKPYRFWLRYATRRWEVRAGLQKLNFGAAKMLRPLMWFDGMDIRDPLQLTNGVYGLLGRYYFDNNATLWAWGLMGNKLPKGYEPAGSAAWKPEVGGRAQVPLGPGELALSYHHRKVNPASNALNMSFLEASLPENRLGIDGKWDVGVGVWVEASLTALKKDNTTPELLPSRTDMFNTGLDYTVPLGNGVGITLEYFRYHAGNRFITGGSTAHVMASMVSYPVSLLDNLSLMVFYIPAAAKNYWMNYLSWSRNYDNWSLYLIAFINPEDYSLPVMATPGRNVFAGKGFQFMLSYNF